MTELRFIDLQRANKDRLKIFPGHSNDAWNANDWMVAITGEVGELANKLKKLRRGIVIRNKELPTKEDIEEEIADIIIYTDLLATYFNIDTASAVVKKFNRVSQEIDPDRMPML